MTDRNNFEHFEWGIICWIRKNNLQLVFFEYTILKLLSVYFLENMLHGEKVSKFSRSWLRREREHHKKIVDPFLKTKIGLIKPKNHLTLLSLIR